MALTIFNWDYREIIKIHYFSALFFRYVSKELIQYLFVISVASSHV